jgi:hypothetical protein
LLVPKPHTQTHTLARIHTHARARAEKKAVEEGLHKEQGVTAAKKLQVETAGKKEELIILLLETKQFS